MCSCRRLTPRAAAPCRKRRIRILLELVRGKAGRVIGNATALMVTVKGLPLAYNKDLQETQEPLFDAADTVLALLPLVTGWMKAVEFDLRTHAARQRSRDS